MGVLRSSRRQVGRQCAVPLLCPTKACVPCRAGQLERHPLASSVRQTGI